MKRNHLFISALLLVIALISCSNKIIYKNKNSDVEQRIEDLLSRMTLDEKIEQLSGYKMDTRENTRLGIPGLKMTDGPVGVTLGTSTALPSPVALASSWDRDLMRNVGGLLGRETKENGRNCLLAPCVNIHRIPVGGRNFESFGEDPYLASQIAVPYIQGVQSEDVLACVKHFACNNQEWNRKTLDVIADERTMHEIYFPMFKAAVQEGKVWSVMASYNLVNGIYACENNYLLNEVLKDKWGFKGFVVSDWRATRSTVGSINGGLDIEMPNDKYLNNEDVKQALADKLITEERIDEMVRRILRVKFEAGFFDHPQKESKGYINSRLHNQIAYEAAVNGIVLLKNENDLLPIDPEKFEKIAVIGPNTAYARVGGGGSAKVYPPYSVSPLEGLTSKADKRLQFEYSLGTAIKDDIRVLESKYFTNKTNKHCLQAEYFTNPNLEGKPHFTREDEEINFMWYFDAPRPDMYNICQNREYSARWKGKINTPASGEYKFFIRHTDGVRLKINGETIIENWKENVESTIDTCKISLKENSYYDLELEYFKKSGISEIKLGWEIPGEDLIAEAVELAKNSDMAVIFAGLSDQFEGEGRDKNFLVLENQDTLIKAVSKANPNTAVVMITGTPPVMEAWADDVPTIVQAWFGGQEGGNAIADVLLGNANPSGKLPSTFYVKKEDAPGLKYYRNENLKSVYHEGIFVGYRYLEKNNIEPRFAFGHGLSYTDFEYGEVKLKEIDGQTFELIIPVSNTEKMAGSEVVQVYVGEINPQVARPVKELKAFEKIKLQPGDQQNVRIQLDKNAFSFYNVDIHDWQVSKGDYKISIGSSSRDIRKEVSLTVQ